MNRISNSFTRGRDGDLLNDSGQVIHNMTNNPLFPDPNPTLVVLQQATEEYRVALHNAAGKDTVMVSIKNDKRAVLRARLTQLAEYVTSVANGDRTVLLSSGFILVRGKGEVATLKPIEKLMVNTDTPEQAVLRVLKVTGAKAYMHQYTIGAFTSESQWISRTITEPLYTITGLQSGVQYAFRVIAIGPGQQSVYSPVVSRYIQ